MPVSVPVSVSVSVCVCGHVCVFVCLRFGRERVRHTESDKEREFARDSPPIQPQIVTVSSNYQRVGDLLDETSGPMGICWNPCRSLKWLPN